MSLKRRLFRSNMLILSTALFALLILILCVLMLFEDTFERQFLSLEQGRLDIHVMEAAQAVSEADVNMVDELQQQVGKWGYQAAVLYRGRIAAGKNTDGMNNLAELFSQKKDMEGRTDSEILFFYHQGVTVTGKYVPGQDVWLVAAHFPTENWLASSLKRSFFTLLSVILLIGTGIIMVLLFLASCFTKRLNRAVMKPVEELTAGAERIQNGDLKQDILYEGDEEFENVCRTFNTMQRTIREDQEQRERNERARTDMVTGISHDLRTPLTSIQGYIKGVLDGVADTPDKKRLYLWTAYASAEEMNVLLQKLFDFSRMESGQLPFHMVRVELAEFTASYIAQKEGILKEQGVRFHFISSQNFLSEICMDVEQVRRVLDNLLENSMKYVKARPLQIEVTVYDTPNQVVLEWRDNGEGVPEAKLEHIFDRFYRCDEARSEKGSGIGLYVVRYIMERHHGTVTAENAGGLKIQLYFPKETETFRR